MKPLILLALSMIACGGTSQHSTSESHHQGGPPADGPCGDIIRVCHGADQGEGEIHDCHVNAHRSWTGEDCALHREACLAVCAPAP